MSDRLPKLTHPRQRAVLNAIIRLREAGVSPSFRDIADEMHCDISVVHRWVHRLIDAGYVTPLDRRSRALQPTHAPSGAPIRQARWAPLIGDAT